MRIEKFLESSTLFQLTLSHSQILGDFQKRLAKDHVHFLQALILTGMFFEERPVQPTELAQTFSCPKSNISHALRDLEKKKLIERSTPADDARAYLFSLTKEGKRTVPKLIKTFDTTEDHLEARQIGKSIILQLKKLREA